MKHYSFITSSEVSLYLGMSSKLPEGLDPPVHSVMNRHQKIECAYCYNVQGCFELDFSFFEVREGHILKGEVDI